MSVVNRLGCAAAVAVVAGLVSAGPAGAIAGLERVGAVTASDSTSPKAVTATCPSGKNVLGGSAALFTGSHGQILIDDIAPDANLTSVVVTAYEDADGTAGTWRLGAYAYCAPPPAGLQLVTATGATSSANKGVTAFCPSGKRVFGTGAAIGGTTFDPFSGKGRVVLDDITPSRELTASTVTGNEAPLFGGNPDSWFVRSYAICATPPFGLHRAITASVSDSANKTAVASCSSGFRVHGSGGDVNAGIGEVSIEALVASSGLTRSSASAVEGQTAPTTNWNVRSYAICAP